MKRPLSLILLMVLFSFSSCGPGEDKVERIIEGGVEVVINHIDPYVLGGEPSRLVLEEQFVIDLENENFVSTRHKRSR